MTPQASEQEPSARLPLQIGTAATWAAARAALAAFPGLASFGIGLIAIRDDWGDATGVPFVLGGLLLAYAGFYLRLSRRARASDLLCFVDALAIDGGPLGGSRIRWSELSAPYAVVEESKEKRLVLWRLPVTAFLAVGGEGDPEEEVPVWRLAVFRRGKRIELAETDRSSEAASMRAAVATIESVVSGRRSIEHAPRIRADIATCSQCGAALIPSATETVVCAYCNETVKLPAHIRRHAAASIQISEGRRRTTRIVERLMNQPRASSINFGLGVVTLLMFAAWPIGWTLVGVRVFHAGFHLEDLLGLLLPFSAVLAGFFFARALLADRAALRLLTLGFGALAPARTGEPSRCRRCTGPLPEHGPGGVVRCLHCDADNIAGIDLRPIVDGARSEAKSFDAALAVRRRELAVWTLLGFAAILVFAAFVAMSYRYASADW